MVRWSSAAVHGADGLLVGLQRGPQVLEADALGVEVGAHREDDGAGRAVGAAEVRLSAGGQQRRDVGGPFLGVLAEGKELLELVDQQEQAAARTGQRRGLVAQRQRVGGSALSAAPRPPRRRRPGRGPAPRTGGRWA